WEGSGEWNVWEEGADGVEGPGVRIWQEGTPAGDLRHPDGEPASSVGVVNRLLHREVVGEEVPAREVAAKEERIGVNGDEQETEGGAPGEGTLFHAAALWAAPRRRRIAAAAANTTGPHNDAEPPGTSSFHSTRCRPLGMATAENASCAGKSSTRRPSRRIVRKLTWP